MRGNKIQDLTDSIKYSQKAWEQSLYLFRNQLIFQVKRNPF